MPYVLADSTKLGAIGLAPGLPAEPRSPRLSLDGAGGLPGRRRRAAPRLVPPSCVLSRLAARGPRGEAAKEVILIRDRPTPATDRRLIELDSYGYRQQFVRSLRHFESFAVAFSFISITTGIFTTYGFALATGGPRRVSGRG